MSAPLISAFARMVSWLPLSANQALGATLGRLIWILNASPRRITEINLRLCHPDMPAAERLAFARQSIIETGKQFTECGWIWHRPIEQTLRKIVSINGQELLNQARQSSQGIIWVTPHIGNWELCCLPLSRTHPLTYFYRSPRKADMDALLIKWRAHLGGKPATLDISGIKEGLKLLKNGEELGLLPDQEPNLQNGLFAPFFGEPALTMTLLSKLAKRSSAIVLFCVAERLPRGRGWIFHILPSHELIASPDLAKATNALNGDVERCIALCPTQYLWDYKRFNTQKDGTARNYREK